MQFKLGKRPHKHDDRTLKLANYITLVAPPKPQPTIDWNAAFDRLGGVLGMDGNGADPNNPPNMPNGAGDCFFAAMEHSLEIKYANAHGRVTMGTTADVLAAYCGYLGITVDELNDQNDEGTVMLDGLKFMRKIGMNLGTDGNHKIGAFVQVNHHDHDEVRVALDLFGGLHIGVMFPEAWENAQVWDKTDSRIVGGHAILGTAHDVVHPVRIVTWGGYRYMTWEGIDQQCDEIFVSLDPDWLIDGSNSAPNGIDWTTLNHDLIAVGV